MKHSKHALVALLAVLAASTATAQSMNMDSGYYGEVGYSALKFDDGSSTPTPQLARFIVGKNINENLAFEGMAAFTVSKDTWQEGVNKGELSGKHLGIYAKPKMEIAKNTEIFGRIGVSHTSWKSNSSAGDGNDSFTKLAYGLGVQTQFTKDVYGQVDYMDLGKKDGVSAKGFTVSVGTSF
jgi:opacity protein-like surface antigen